MDLLPKEDSKHQFAELAHTCLWGWVLLGPPRNFATLQLGAHLDTGKGQSERSNMSILEALSRSYFLFVVLFASFVPAHAQKYDIAPPIGGRYGGALKLGQQGVSPNVDERLADSVGFGVAGGVRIPAEDCEACGLIEFRWMRADTHIGLKQDPLVPPPVTTPFTGTTRLTLASFRPAVTLDLFLADFTYEWRVREAQNIRPFAIVSLGPPACRLPQPAPPGSSLESEPGSRYSPSRTGDSASTWSTCP